MGQKLFIPITDEVLYEYPELITSPLRPYQVDNPCFHWLGTIENEKGEIEKVFNHRVLEQQERDHRTSRLA